LAPPTNDAYGIKDLEGHLVIPTVCQILKRITGDLISRTNWLNGRGKIEPE